MLDLKFPKMVIANSFNFSYFYNDRRECLRNMHISPADRSGRR